MQNYAGRGALIGAGLSMLPPGPFGPRRRMLVRHRRFLPLVAWKHRLSPPGLSRAARQAPDQGTPSHVEIGRPTPQLACPTVGKRNMMAVSLELSCNR